MFCCLLDMALMALDAEYRKCENWRVALGNSTHM